MRTKKTKKISKEDMMFLASNLAPKYTNLPMIVWISAKPNDDEPCAIRVQKTHNEKSDFENAAIVSVEDCKILNDQSLDEADLKAVKQFIKVNKQAILDHWHYETDSLGMLNAIVKV